jgi:hypothetical protein
MTPDEAITEFLNAIEYLNQERALIAVRLLCEKWPTIKPWLKMSPPLVVRMGILFSSQETGQRIINNQPAICAKILELQKRLDDPVPEYARLPKGER